MSWRLILSLAIAETRRLRGVLLFAVFAVAVGVAAVTAVRTAVLGLEAGVADQARSLLGADLVIESNNALGPEAAELTRALEAEGARHADLTWFYSMLYRPAARSASPGVSRSARAQSGGLQANAKGGPRPTAEGAEASGTLLVVARGVSAGFPFYGKIETDPPQAWRALTGSPEPSLIAAPDVMEQLGLLRGDRVRLGRAYFRVIGRFVPRPGSPAAGVGFAPTVYVNLAHLAGTGLLERGSRIRHERLFAVPPSFDAESWKEARWETAVRASLVIRTHREAAAGLQRFLWRLSHYLTTAGLVTLLLGGVGIGAAVTAFVRERLDHAAVLRSLGALPGEVFRIYLVTALFLGGAGSLLGVLVGGVGPVLAGDALRSLVEESRGIPFLVDLRFSWRACLEGALVGLAGTFVFTLIPVHRLRSVSPLRIFRREADPVPVDRKRDLLLYGATVLLFALLIALTALTQTESLSVSLFFTGAVLAAALLIVLPARGLVKLTRLAARRIKSYRVRQGVSNLHRPGNQTTAVVTAVGVGSLLLTGILILDSSLRKELAITDRPDMPNHFVIDVQPGQRAPLVALLQRHGAEGIVTAPMIAARISSLNGKSISEGVERNAARRSWDDQIRTREYLVSFRAELLDSERVTSGRFWARAPAGQEVSVDEDWARRIGAQIGDRLTMDIQGLPLDARITSMRHVEWRAMRPNVMLLFSPGPIETAPRMYVASFRMADKGTRYRMRRALVGAFSNVSVVDVTEAAANIGLIANRIAGVIGFLALITVMNGMVILAGAVAAGRFARVREAMLLKVLGANRALLRNILTVEYAVLAGLGCLCGWVLGEIISRVMLSFFFDAPVVVPYGRIALALAAILASNTAVGLLISRDTARARPLDILREES